MEGQKLRRPVQVCLSPEDGRPLEMRIVSHDGENVDWVELHGDAGIGLNDIRAMVKAVLSGPEIQRLLAAKKSDTELADANAISLEQFAAQREARSGLRASRLGMRPA